MTATEEDSLRHFGLSATTTKIAGGLLQIYLGFIFLPADFGLVALFTSVALFANALRDGGVKNELIRLKLTVGDTEVAIAYWLAWMVNVLLAAGLALLAEPIAEVYGSPELSNLILCLALTYPLGTLWSVCGAVIQTGISTRTYAAIEIQGEAVRLVSTVTLLAFWPNPLALAVGICLQSIWLSVRSKSVVSLHIRQPWPGVTALAGTWRRTRWLMSGTLAAALLQSGDYLALGLAASASTLGAYYFAYSLPAQAGLVAVAVGDSMLLHLTRSRSPQRTRVLLSATRQLVTLTGLLTYTLAVSLPFLEQIIWGGRWAFAVPAAQVLSIAFPIRLTFIIQKAALVTAGNHRQWTTLTVAQGAGLASTAALVGSRTSSVTTIALYVGAYLVTSTVMALVLALRPDGVRPAALLGALLSGLLPPATGAVAGLVAFLGLVSFGAEDLTLLMASVIVAVSLGVGLLVVSLLDDSLHRRLSGSLWHPIQRGLRNRRGRN